MLCLRHSIIFYEEFVYWKWLLLLSAVFFPGLGFHFFFSNWWLSGGQKYEKCFLFLIKNNAFALNCLFLWESTMPCYYNSIPHLKNGMTSFLLFFFSNFPIDSLISFLLKMYIKQIWVIIFLFDFLLALFTQSGAFSLTMGHPRKKRTIRMSMILY